MNSVRNLYFREDYDFHSFIAVSI